MFPEFFDFLAKFDIFALSETHITDEYTKNFERYFKDFALLWKPAIRSSNYGRASGGCLYGVKKNLTMKNISYQFNQKYGMDYINIKGYGTQFELIPIYINGATWMAEFEGIKHHLREDMAQNTILVGDMNARIGEAQQNIEETFVTTFHADLGLRKSKDTTRNTRGNKILEMCEDYGLVILNGRTTGDESGSYTFISHLGNSVNDLCAVSLRSLEWIDAFEVASKPWSDHLPIIVSFRIMSAQKTNEGSLIPRKKWNDKYKVQYQSELGKKVTKVKQERGFSGVNDLIKLIEKSIPRHPNAGNLTIFKSVWFNNNCYKARNLCFKALNNYRKSNKNEDKEIYLKARKEYKELCEKSKEDYEASMVKKINAVTDSKSWWSLAKELKTVRNILTNEISANEFRRYFENLLKPNQAVTPILYAPILCTDEMLDSVISVEEINCILNRVKKHKAPGIDGITYEFYKNAPQNFKEELALLFNVTFETGKMTNVFTDSVMVPLFKKGLASVASNYRGISFMNCGAKLLMGIINSRLNNWVREKGVVNEFQAGFRQNYSTIDNVFNLTSIVQLKLKENKKVYGFFVDFKAAFDKVPRNLLFYKLHAMGVSTKLVYFIESVYKQTKVAVRVGEEMSDFFETSSGLKQGCLLSPLLFILYINDLHNTLGGGLNIAGINVRILMYADDIVLLAEDHKVLQTMIDRLEAYCNDWGMEVNLNKSEIMIFRNGGKLASYEKWKYKAESIKIVNEFNYLGVILTPKCSFTKHVEMRNVKAKNSINATWANFLSLSRIKPATKWKLFQAICRAIQSYGAQIWGLDHFEDVDQLQRYFIKRILKLPDNVPNYAIRLETNLEEGHFYTLGLCLNYIHRNLYELSEERLPHILAREVLKSNVFWAKQLNNLGLQFQLNFEIMEQKEWVIKGKQLVQSLRAQSLDRAKKNAEASNSRFYKFLNHDIGIQYMQQHNTLERISLIFKARSDSLALLANRYNMVQRRCTLCNLREDESLVHFMARCPVMREFRIKYLGSSTLNETELVKVLNGELVDGWNKLFNYLKLALTYRQNILNEYF